MTSRAMSDRSVYLWLAVQPSSAAAQEGRRSEASLPIAFDASNLASFEGFFSPIEGVRWLLVDDAAVIAAVGFGTAAPDDALLAEASAVLSTLSLATPEPG